MTLTSTIRLKPSTIADKQVFVVFGDFSLKNFNPHLLPPAPRFGSPPPAPLLCAGGGESKIFYRGEGALRRPLSSVSSSRRYRACGAGGRGRAALCRRKSGVSASPEVLTDHFPTPPTPRPAGGGNVLFVSREKGAAMPCRPWAALLPAPSSCGMRGTPRASGARGPTPQPPPVRGRGRIKNLLPRRGGAAAPPLLGLLIPAMPRLRARGNDDLTPRGCV